MGGCFIFFVKCVAQKTENFPLPFLRIDWCVQKMDELYNEYHEDRYRCSPLLRKMSRDHSNFLNNAFTRRKDTA